MLRLFVALGVSNTLKTQFSKLPRGGLDAPRWAHIDDLHITLRFIGEADEARLSEIESNLSRVRAAPFNIVVKGLSIFEKKKQSVLFAPIESHRKITHLCAEVTDALTRAGFEFPVRAFMPHVTLARLKTARDLNGFIVKNFNHINADWRVESFGLYESADSLNDDTARYKILKNFDLQ
jgi:2'-5' RNA ligase